jgi:transposase
MDVHKNAPLTPKGREAMVRSVIEGGLGKATAARQFNTTAKTVAKWVDRFRAEGVDGLNDRSSRPLSSPSQTPPATCAAVEALRRQRYIGRQIAIEVGVSPATVSRILRRLGLNRMRDLEPAEPVRRYEREHPGELIHIDIKKLGNSIASVTASPVTGPARAIRAGSAGSSSMSASTTPPGLPSAE